MDFKPGDILAGKYRIERVLGQGGMGVVVAATHLQLDELVALKFLLPDALSSPEAVARFAREARAAVKIKSEHVALVTDVGSLENGSPYMVMEHLKGKDLSERIREQGCLGVPESVELVLQACEALAEAHSLGIIHRDLKPANLFLVYRRDGSPCVKILDFGISKFTGVTGSSGPDYGMTKTTAVMGSPQYMSPEQLTSARDVDPRTDIWAMGVVLYELLSGRLPFEAESLGQLVGTILVEPPRPLLAQRPDLPPELDRVISCCLEKDRTRRFSNIGDFAQALLPFAPHSATRSVDRVSRVLALDAHRDAVPAGESMRTLYIAPNTGSVPGTHASWGQTLPRKPRRSAWVIAALAVPLLACGVLFAAHHWQAPPKRGGADSPPASPSASSSRLTPEAGTVQGSPSASSTVTPAESARPKNSTTPATSASSEKTTPIRPQPLPPTQPTVTPQITAHPNCDPSFTFDGQGRRHFKPECFVKQGANQ